MKDKGVGDTVERVIKFFGYKKKCKKCKKRKELLNKKFPYGKQ
jgi:hypothetical protein